MKSDVIHVTNTGEGIAEAIKQTEAVATFKSLDEKDSVHLMLLAEEMMGLMKGLAGKHEGDFWIEDEDGTFRLHLKVQIDMNAQTRKKLLSASTSGENIAAKGVSGKIRDLFNRILEPAEDTTGAYEGGWSSEEMTTAQAAAYAKGMSVVANRVWSLKRYNASRKKEEWDELEQPIVTNIADEIQIGITEHEAEMIIYKKM
ncbi:MAG: hypothetical protein E7517_00745 [Ruminococcaceae bacterium]|nr:hypothetical protein [Oscillospiraceae bacterium]